MLKATKQTTNGKPTISFSKRDEYITLIDRFSDGEELLIEIESKRTLSQNRLFHLIVKIISNEIGESFEYTKAYIVIKIWGSEEINIDGKIYNYPKSTSLLSKEEMKQGLNAIYPWALETFNVNLPSNEYLI